MWATGISVELRAKELPSFHKPKSVTKYSCQKLIFFSGILDQFTPAGRKFVDCSTRCLVAALLNISKVNLMREPFQVNLQTLRKQVM